MTMIATTTMMTMVIRLLWSDRTYIHPSPRNPADGGRKSTESPLGPSTVGADQREAGSGGLGRVGAPPTASATTSPTRRSAGSTPKTARLRSASAASTASPASWSRGSGASCCDADEKEVGGTVQQGRGCRPPCSPRPTCRTWPRSSPPSTSSRSRAREVGHPALLRARSNSSRSTSTSAFWATVPKEYDPVSLRELFSPGFLTWVTTMTGEIDFGVQRSPALVPLAPARAAATRAESRPGECRRTVQSGCRERSTREASTPTLPGPGTPAWRPFPEGGGLSCVFFFFFFWVVGIAGENDPVVLEPVPTTFGRIAFDRAIAVGGECLVGGAEGQQRLQLGNGGKGESQVAGGLAPPERRSAGARAASVVSTPSGLGGVWAGARARKNQASKRGRVHLRV